MHVSKEVDYGLRAMIVIASNDELLNTKEISKRFRIPYNFLSLILPKLVRGGLVTSVQGPKGGYKLAKNPNEISFLDVITALEGPIHLIECNEPGSCDLDQFCSMVDVWGELKTYMDGYFGKITLDRCVNPKLKDAAGCEACTK